jgi:hypothetical protein
MSIDRARYSFRFTLPWFQESPRCYKGPYYVHKTNINGDRNLCCGEQSIGTCVFIPQNLPINIYPRGFNMSTRNIIDLNNDAVSSLQQGRHYEAVDLLRTAIADLMKLFVLPSLSSAHILSSDGSDNDGHTSPIKVDKKQDKPSMFSVPLWSEETCTRQQDKTSVFMYSQALVLSDDDHCEEFLIGVVFYNMALVNHARAMETEIASLLTTALNFYDMAVTITQSRDDDVGAFDHWLLLALYSNMAHIYLSRLCSKKMRECLGGIRSLLATDKAEHVIDADDYFFFVANSVLQIRVDYAPAA